MKKDLCSLSYIFIMENTTNSRFGFWEDPQYHPNPPQNNTYIILNSNDFTKTFSDEQNQTMTNLRVTVGTAIEDPTTFPQSVVPQTFGLLYALAHEMAHIKWHQGLSMSNQPCKNQISGSWANGDIGTGQQRFTSFAYDFGTHSDSSVPKPGANSNQSALDKVYKTGGFATALAAWNPEEDFVESYSLRAVANACGNSCSFQYQIASGDVVNLTDDNGRGNSGLKGKFACADGSTGLLRRRAPK